jgi:hypothetical protein
MAVGVTAQTGFNEQPYITLAEYKNAPTSLDYNNLVVGGNQNAQDAELSRVILRATSYLNEYLNQDLHANPVTETQRTRISNQGYIFLHPNKNPIISLSSFQWGTDPNGLQTLANPALCWFENQQIVIPLSQINTTYTSSGPLAFGTYGPRVPIFTKYTYIAGYVNTTCTGTVGASSLTVANASGILPGETYRIIDGANAESVTVAANYTYGSTTVPLTAPLAATHTVAGFSNMPFAIKQATILMTSAFIKQRGDASMTMNLTTQPTVNIGNNQRYAGEVRLALDMVNLYRRVR